MLRLAWELLCRAWSNCSVSSILCALSPRLRCATLLYVIVCHGSFLIILNLIVGGIGVACDDVPGVQKTRQNSEHTECDVYQTVNAANAALDPDYTDMLVNGRLEGSRGRAYQQWVGRGWR